MGRAAKISVSIDPEVLQEIDRLINTSASRSSVIEDLLRLGLEARHGGVPGAGALEPGLREQAERLERLEVFLRAALALLAQGDRKRLAQAIREAQGQMARLRERGEDADPREESKEQ